MNKYNPKHEDENGDEWRKMRSVFFQGNFFTHCKLMAYHTYSELCMKKEPFLAKTFLLQELIKIMGLSNSRKIINLFT
jgi:hypothetical protein